ncbi:MAG: hypothetical protein GY760_03735 [Deltaproteobacteria bacterium]|nr:hypothetical protein [Deltaproteobacteria bacterium]
MRTNSLIISIVSVLIISTQALCCSSFAVYSDKTIYGMNFDYGKFPMKLKIEESKGVKTFHLSFQRPVGEGRKMWANTAGMNSNGFFGALQEEYSEKIKPTPPGKDTIFIHHLYRNINNKGDVATLETICNEKKLIQFMGIKIHGLFADKTGNAIITEAGDEKNHLIKRKEKFIVMTNFPNRSLKGKTYKEAKGIGDKRYIAGYEYIQKHLNKFDINKGMTALGLMKNKNPGYPTNCSMVFDPVSNNIYVSLLTNYKKVFKISLNNKTLTTFKGFKKISKFKLDANGILVSKLLTL